tara:strand:+ start:194 stop:529 length:336 start_codon:yes stop_codon:yes gene_type:complete
MASDDLQIQIAKATQAKLHAKLSEIGRMARCELCLATNWAVYGAVRLTVQNPLEQTIVIGGNGKTIPLIAITCSNCGNTKLINLGILGVIEKSGAAIANEVDQALRDGNGG